MADDKIFVRCTNCTRRQLIPRTSDDPIDAEEIHVICDRCDRGDFCEPRYYDIDGNEILYDPYNRDIE